jgi:hypothetical protein
MPDDGSCVRQLDDELVLSIRVQPRARNNEILNVRNGRLLVRTTAAPADGKANEAVISLLASFVDIAPSRIRLVRGRTGRNKELRISGPLDLPPAIAPCHPANGL